jgi:hypothetical protein
MCLPGASCAPLCASTRQNRLGRRESAHRAEINPGATTLRDNCPPSANAFVTMTPKFTTVNFKCEQCASIEEIFKASTGLKQTRQSEVDQRCRSLDRSTTSPRFGRPSRVRRVEYLRGGPTRGTWDDNGVVAPLDVYVFRGVFAS